MIAVLGLCLAATDYVDSMQGGVCVECRYTEKMENMLVRRQEK